MRNYIIAATILIGGALSLGTAQAAPVGALGNAFSGAGATTLVRDKVDHDKGDNRGHDKGDHDGKHHASLTPGGFDSSQVMLVRERGEGRKGEGRGHP
jgi:hypothetical protein